MFAWLKKLFAPAALKTASLYGVEYHIATTFSQLHGALAEGKSVMYRYNCTDYMGEMRKLIKAMGPVYGEQSREVSAVLSSPVVCPKCTTLFPDSWKLSAGMASMNGGKNYGCPGCGHPEALLVFVVQRPEDITEADVVALGAYWRSKGQAPEAVESKMTVALQKLKENPSHYGGMELWLARNYAKQQ